MIAPDALRAVPCQVIVLGYTELLQKRDNYFKTAVNPFAEQSAEHSGFEHYRTVMRQTITLELSDPLAALRRQVAGLVEGLFKEKGERTLIFGCMHHQGLQQTQTPLVDLLPQDVCQAKEEHHHSSAVTIDYRYSPDALFDLRLATGGHLLVSDNGVNDLSPVGPDFARRNIQKPAHLEDFQFVRNVGKIYAERVPYVEKGPFNKVFSNTSFFQITHKMLGKNGILAFDYIPNFLINPANRQLQSYYITLQRSVDPAQKEPSDEEVEEFIHHSPYSSYLKTRVSTSDHSIPLFSCQDHQNACSSNPCPSIVRKIARSALVRKKEEEAVSKLLKVKREQIKKLPQAILTTEEVLFEEAKKGIHPLNNFIKGNPKEKLVKAMKSGVIHILAHPHRTQVELDSLIHQVEVYQALNVAPNLIDQIHPETKEVLDLALVTLVNKVVFPQLKMLHFEGVAFDPNGKNPENKRPYERVVYARKLEVV